MRPRTTLLALAALALLPACAPTGDARPDANALALRGTVPITPMDKVGFTLTDTEGRPYDFRARTDGRITLLFFGYTSCPDICPVHMSTLAAALRDVAPEVREQVTVVFVTVDPARDTPERLKGWLHAFDSSFVGLWGSDEEINEALAFYRYPPTETSGEPVGYTVGHPSLIYGFTPDNLARAMYGPETTRAIWVHDLTLMAGHDWSEGGPGGADVDRRRLVAEAGGIQVMDAVVPRPPTATTTAFYFTVRNAGAEADTLLSLSGEVAERTSLHEMLMTEGGIMRMSPLAQGIPLAPGATVRLEPGGMHGMLEGLRELPDVGGTVTLVLRFARAGDVPVPARVVRYEDVGR